eukprot:3009450-Rhodomonas_salina.2
MTTSGEGGDRTLSFACGGSWQGGRWCRGEVHTRSKPLVTWHPAAQPASEPNTWRSRNKEEEKRKKKKHYPTKPLD